MTRTVLVLSAMALVAGCALRGEDTGESSDDVVGASARVTRLADGAFRFETSIPARCDGCRDDDGDGLNDAWEDAALAQLTPAVTFDEDEPMLKAGNHDAFAAIGRVFPAPGDERRVIVSVLLLYARDYGAPNPLCFHAKSHAGDAERAAFEVELVGARGDAITRAAYTTGHEGTPDDQTTILRGADLSKLEDLGGRWRVYSSQAKHATYTSKKHCEEARLHSWTHRFCASEDCAPDGVSDADRFTRLPKVVNVGEVDHPRADDLSDLGFAGVRAWSEERFCGGIQGLSDEERAKCPDPLRTKLPKNPFAE